LAPPCAFKRFYEGGRVSLTNNAAVITAKMNDMDPQAWLADVLARLPYMTASQVPDLLPWNWKSSEIRQAA